MSPDAATIVYSYFFVGITILAGIGILAKHTIAKYTDELKDKLNRIEYALYNDGHTGLINKVDQLIENQNIIKIDVEVMKARVDN
jgi:ABC-type amino acid transport substrate-binding protein